MSTVVTASGLQNVRSRPPRAIQAHQPSSVARRPSPVVRRPSLPSRASCDLPSESEGRAYNTSITTQSLERSTILSAEATCTILDTDDMEGDSAGDGIAYTIDLENTGTTTLTMITVSADLLPQERYVIQR